MITEIQMPPSLCQYPLEGDDHEEEMENTVEMASLDTEMMKKK